MQHTENFSRRRLSKISIIFFVSQLCCAALLDAINFEKRLLKVIELMYCIIGEKCVIKHCETRILPTSVFGATGRISI